MLITLEYLGTSEDTLFRYLEPLFACSRHGLQEQCVNMRTVQLSLCVRRTYLQHLVRGDVRLEVLMVPQLAKEFSQPLDLIWMYE